MPRVCGAAPVPRSSGVEQFSLYLFQNKKPYKLCKPLPAAESSPDILFPSIGSLTDDGARRVLREPAEQLDVVFGDDALDHGLEFSEGYPYFLQEFGEAAWDLASGSQITASDARDARAAVEEKLDSGFFKVRLDRTTELQKAYLRAMAELGPEAQLASTVAELLNRTSPQCGPTRKQLIDKGLLYTTDHGYAAFTVPKFDEYLKRAIPELSPPPIRRRSSKAADSSP